MESVMIDRLKWLCLVVILTVALPAHAKHDKNDKNDKPKKSRAADDVDCQKCVDNSDIAKDTITSNRIKDGAVKRSDIAADAVKSTIGALSGDAGSGAGSAIDGDRQGTEDIGHGGTPIFD
jgi:hypothetical protein